LNRKIISIQLKTIKWKLKKTINMIDLLYKKRKHASETRDQLLNGYFYVDLHGNMDQVLGILAIIKCIEDQIETGRDGNE